MEKNHPMAVTQPLNDSKQEPGIIYHRGFRRQTSPVHTRDTRKSGVVAGLPTLLAWLAPTCRHHVLTVPVVVAICRSRYTVWKPESWNMSAELRSTRPYLACGYGTYSQAQYGTYTAHIRHIYGTYTAHIHKHNVQVGLTCSATTPLNQHAQTMELFLIFRPAPLYIVLHSTVEQPHNLVGALPHNSPRVGGSLPSCRNGKPPRSYSTMVAPR